MEGATGRLDRELALDESGLEFLMSKRRMSDLPQVDPDTGDLLAVIETPKGSRNKYDYDPDLMAFRLGGVLPAGSVFPFDFGFIPSTKADDGDPIDVMVLLDESVPTGCVVSVRLLGAIEAEQREKDGKWVRNDRLIAVATHAHLHKEATSMKDLPSHLIPEVEAFFEQYNRLHGKEFRVVGHCGPKHARKLVDAAKRDA